MEKNLKEIISTRMDFMENIINRIGQLEDMGGKRHWPMGRGKEVIGQSLNALLKEAEVLFA